MPNSFEAFEHGRQRRLRHGFSIDREQAAGAEEVALPELVLGMARQCRMEHARDLGPPLEPARDLDARAPMPLQPHVDRAHAPQAQIHLLRAGADAQAAGLGDQPGCASGSVTVMAPSMASAWPTMYLVAAWIEMSTPCVNGLK